MGWQYYRRARGNNWLWRGRRLRRLGPITAEPLTLLRGIDRQRDDLLANTRAFARGRPAHDALLWGVRGMGKSSLARSVCHAVAASIAVVDIRVTDIDTVDDLGPHLSSLGCPVVILCDDLCFAGDGGSRAHILKSFLESGQGMRSVPFVFYATSNRRHVSGRTMASDEAHPGDALQDDLALSDRFGLWLGFHGCDDAQWRDMLKAHARARRLTIDVQEIITRADQWAGARGGRSGRAAAQYMRHLAAHHDG